MASIQYSSLFTRLSVPQCTAGGDGCMYARPAELEVDKPGGGCMYGRGTVLVQIG